MIRARRSKKQGHNAGGERAAAAIVQAGTLGDSDFGDPENMDLKFLRSSVQGLQGPAWSRPSLQSRALGIKQRKIETVEAGFSRPSHQNSPGNSRQNCSGRIETMKAGCAAARPGSLLPSGECQTVSV